MAGSLCLNFTTGCKEASAPVRDSGNPGILACGIWNPGLWYLDYSSKNPEYQKRLESRIQVPKTNWILELPACLHLSAARRSVD